jgi:hypothetical protein
MKYQPPVAIAVFLVTILVRPASAQAPALTNADVVRLVALRVSAQTVITVVQEAVATQFDLSPQAAIELAGQGVPVAVIGAMRQVSTLSTTVANGAASEPPSGGQTLAGAAAEAAAAAQARSLVASPSLEVPPPAAIAAAAIVTTSAPAPDEAEWRARLAPLHLTLRDDRAKEGPLLNRLNSLASELSRLGPSDVKRSGVVTERQRLTAKLTALREALRADLAAVQVLEEAGRHAGVPPAWLR